MKHRVWLLAACLLLGPSLVAARDAPGRGSPDVLLIVTDTLRADHVGAYGYSRDTTKYIDSFADHAHTFRNAYAQAPCTTPSMWNIVTSKYHSPMPADDDDTTMAEYFKSRHYRTGAFLAQHQLNAESSNLGQGFDVYDQRSGRDRHGLSTRTAGSVVDAAIDWMKRGDERPLFAWLVLYDPHDPYSPPQEYRGYYTNGESYSRDRRAEGLHGFRNDPISDVEREFLISAYDEEVRYLDHEFGRLLTYLKDSGRYAESLIVVTSDHGEELGDHGNRWDHCQLLSQEEIRIPLMIKMPGQTKGIVRHEPVQHIDIYPTVVDYLERPRLPASYDELEGISLMPLVDGTLLDEDRYAAAFWHDQRVLVKGEYKYWRHGDEELLIETATGEQRTQERLLHGMRQQIDDLYRTYFVENEEFEEILKRLTALGYIHE